MSEDLDVERAIRTAVDWLLKIQDSGSGGWPERPGQAPSTLNTAEAIISLLDSRLVNCGDKAVKKGLSFLKKHHRPCPAEEDKGAWPREIQVEHGEQELLIPDLVRTSFAVQAIARCEGTDSDLVKDAVAWIKAVKNKDDGGWGFRRGGPSSITPTCFALKALIEAAAGGMQDCSDPILQGLKFLVGTCRNGDGSYGNNEALKPVQTINATLLIQSARARAGLGAYTEEERQAIDWLREHPDRAISQVEEEIEIGQPCAGCGNYSFSFMTPALLLELLMRSVDKEDRKGRLAEFAMLALKDMRDESLGAFKGARVFSWSTSKVLAGLSSVEQHVEFPVRKTESRGLKAGHAILVFSLFLSLAVIYLTMNNRFHVLQATFFMLMMLCSLLAYRLIGEATFADLIKTAWGAIGKSGKDEKKGG
ncbi:MAG: terpene cyclase/mutase family protein [Nitrospirales bacterium]|nr:terpene cyclase/mutase family protein [Nitrospirales bacterium]